MGSECTTPIAPCKSKRKRGAGMDEPVCPDAPRKKPMLADSPPTKHDVSKALFVGAHISVVFTYSECGRIHVSFVYHDA